MPNTKGLVNKPQFDKSIFKLGVALNIKNIVSSNDNPLSYGFDRVCIVCKYSPLELEVISVDSSGEHDTDRIPVQCVADNQILISFLTEEK